MVKSEKPLDYASQVWRGIDDKFPKKIHNASSTADGLMSAEDKAKLDAIDLGSIQDRIYDVATWETDGLMSKEDKKKMDGIEQNANNYIHPNTPEIRHVTDQQIAYWNAKASTAIATQTTNGLMSAADKLKLDNIEEYATHFVHPLTHPATMIVQDTNHRFVTDVQIKYWNEKASTVVANPDSDGLMSAADKKKLDSIEEGANRYIHPDNEGIRHVNDAEKKYWNSKADKTLVTNSENGLMAAVDKVKLDGIESGANNYVHPTGSGWMHVTEEQIKYWDSKPSTINIDVATQNKDGLMSKEDKKKMDGIEAKANNYVHPLTHPATMIAEDEDHKFVSKDQITSWDSKPDTDTTYDVATVDEDGLMSKEDKKKLDELNITFTAVPEVPTEGEHAQNQVLYSANPVQSGCVGWVCIESGNPGKWEPFGILESSKVYINCGTSKFN